MLVFTQSSSSSKNSCHEKDGIPEPCRWVQGSPHQVSSPTQLSSWLRTKNKSAPYGTALPCLGHVVASHKSHRDKLSLVFLPLSFSLFDIRCVKNQLHICAEFRTPFRFLLLGRFASWERTDDTSEGLQMLRLEGQFWRVWTVRTPFFVHGGCKKSLTLVAINFTWSISNTEGWLIMCFGLSIVIEKKHLA